MCIRDSVISVRCDRCAFCQQRGETFAKLIPVRVPLEGQSSGGFVGHDLCLGRGKPVEGVRQGGINDRCSCLPDEFGCLGESLGGGLLGEITLWRATQADARWLGAGCDTMEVGAAGQHGGQKCCVRHAPREGSDCIQGFRDRLHTSPMDQAEGRLVSHHAAVGGWADNRTRSLGAQRQWNHVVCRGGGRASGTGPRRGGWCLRIDGFSGVEDRELSGYRLAEDHGARGPERRYRGGVPNWTVTAVYLSLIHISEPTRPY